MQASITLNNVFYLIFPEHWQRHEMFYEKKNVFIFHYLLELFCLLHPIDAQADTKMRKRACMAITFFAIYFEIIFG